MITLRYRRIFLLTAMATLFLSGCFEKEPLTDHALLGRTTLGCFQTSFSLAKKRYPNDIEKANHDINAELYPCMVRNILGTQAPEDQKQALSQQYKEACPFPGLTLVVRKEIVACLEKASLPSIQNNQAQQRSN
ncbi:MAG: hypothetical protein HQL72_09705 [Magnetococcales bacterium]|nr:hypothetical protein [Magnetococcales bacterium]